MTFEEAKYVIGFFISLIFALPMIIMGIVMLRK